MVDSMSTPKQMMAYDRFELTGSGYIFHDDEDPYFEETSEEEIPRGSASRLQEMPLLPH